MIDNRKFGWTVRYRFYGTHQANAFRPAYRICRSVNAYGNDRTETHEQALAHRYASSESFGLNMRYADRLRMLRVGELYLAPLQLFDRYDVVLAICNALNEQWHDRYYDKADSHEDAIRLSSHTTLDRVAIPMLNGSELHKTKVSIMRLLVVPACTTYEALRHSPGWLDVPHCWHDISLGPNKPTRGKFHKLTDPALLTKLYGAVCMNTFYNNIYNGRHWAGKDKMQGWFPESKSFKPDTSFACTNGYDLI